MLYIGFCLGKSSLFERGWMKRREREWIREGKRKAQTVRRRAGRGTDPGQKGTAGGGHRSKKEVIVRNSRNTGECVQWSWVLQWRKLKMWQIIDSSLDGEPSRKVQFLQARQCTLLFLSYCVCWNVLCPFVFQESHLYWTGEPWNKFFFSPKHRIITKAWVSSVHSNRSEGDRTHVWGHRQFQMG